ncbi:MAG: serpin family protein, partial [Fimbriimonadales bacterium]|nr:serpin family protein [Fimbriimonadales bacterium]
MTEPMRTVWIGLIGVLLLGGCGTSGVGTQPQTQHRQEPAPRGTQVKINPQGVNANLQFGFQLLHELDKRREGPNLFFSPMSVSLALTMVLNGARGETYRQMANALGYGEQPIEAINAENALLLHLLRSPDPKTETLVANSLWVHQGFTLMPSFMQACQQHYEAAVDTVDFIQDREGAAQRINGWVKENTKGLIAELFKPNDFNNYTRLVVVNTLYFKGKWQKPFNKEATSEQEFYLGDGKTKRVPMMHQSGKFDYLKGDGFQAVALPYGEGELSFYLFLPDEGRSLDEFLKGLTPARWNEWFKGFKPMEGDVGLPRFRIEATYPLEAPLKAMGMTDAFDPERADLSGIAPLT